MKKIIFFLVALLAVATVFAQAKQPIEFKETKHSFGKVKQHVPVTYVFTFKNISDKPVVIENATAECGCTTPEFPKSAIAKGATNKISVTYNSEALGGFTKKVTVKLANVAEPVYLFIEGEVVGAASVGKTKAAPKAPAKAKTAKG
ncbi:MAG: hypothetical protein JWQ96_3315 [Segetibacter sp.]|nr:hypothetical protein [Segetibacter sp.]